MTRAETRARLVALGVVEGKSTQTGWNLHEANLSGLGLGGADLSGADLSEADLSGADLSYSTLKGTDLEGAILQDAKLRGTNLIGANLKDADFRGADLTHALIDPNAIEGQKRRFSRGVSYLEKLALGLFARAKRKDHSQPDKSTNPSSSRRN